MKFLKKRWFLITLVLIALGFFIRFYLFGAVAPTYLTEEVKRQDLEVTILADGKFEASEQVDVGAQVSGQIKKLHVALGDSVKKGELIAEIDDLPQQNALKDSEARLKNALASKAAKEAQKLNGEIVLKRQEVLIKQKATTQSELDLAEANLSVFVAELSALDAQIAQAQIALDSAKLNLTYTKILAPIDGVIVATVVKEGQTVNALQSAPTIVKVANLALMTIKAQISEADITKVNKGMSAYFTILGEPNKRYPAVLKQMEPAPESFQTNVGNTATSTNEAIYYNGLFNVDNSENIFLIDMTTQVYIVVDSVKDALVVPSMATRFKPSDETLWPPERLQKGEAVIWSLTKDQILMPHKVKLGVSNNVHTQILEGVNEATKVVLSEKLADTQSSQSMRMPRR